MPEPPYRYLSSEAPLLDLSEIEDEISTSETQRQEAFVKSQKIQKSLLAAHSDLEQSKGNASQWIASLRSALVEAASINGDHPTGRIPRTGNLNHRVEDLCRFMAFSRFLATGDMLPPSACSTADLKVTDEEYLAGACMGAAQDLSRYAMGRATARDVRSVRQARDLIGAILDYLLQFDFRNGFLRRRYDGVKYALKAAETLLYELSVTGASESEEPSVATARIEPISPPTHDELNALRLRMEHRDSLREDLIKKCRDGQKAAKQAIYALHRGDFARSSELRRVCRECITQELLPIVEEEPPLRRSSYGEVVEEYAEAELFSAWLLGKEGEREGEPEIGARARGTLLLPSEFSVPLDPGEYLGGLCDLTGEIGRYAVQRGTARDFDGVRQCLEANMAILNAVQSLDSFPKRIEKKMDMLRTSVSKIERMIYEMSLSKAAGMSVSSEVTEVEPSGNRE